MLILNSGESMLISLDPDSTLRVIDALTLPKLESAALTRSPERVSPIIIILLICLSELLESEVSAAGNAHLVAFPRHRDIPSWWTTHSLLFSLDGRQVHSLGACHCVAGLRLVLDLARTVFFSLADTGLAKRQ
jgi:hypothetical protein